MAGSIALGGCAMAPAPIAHTPNVVPAPQPGQVVVNVKAAPTVGEVTPLYVTVANGKADMLSVVPSQIFALNDVGERIAPLPPGEAARQAGNAKELQGAMQSAALSGVSGGAIGAAAGAVAGSAGNSGGGWGFNSPGAGALIGTGIGGGWGAFYGATAGQNKADQQADQQIDALALKPGDLRRNFVANGYVFFPKGNYNQVEVLLVNPETGATETFSEAWQ